MRRKKPDHWELEQYLGEPVANWGWDPHITREQARQAKAALERTLDRARERLPDTCHVFIGQQDRPLHDCDKGYLSHMVRLRTCLKKASWNEACDELSHVLHFYHIEDGRVLNEIIATLEEFL